MSERADIARIVAGCERYWRETGVARRVVTEMRLELEQHLTEAAAEGRAPERVVGSDVAAFAEAWAAEHRRARPGAATFAEVASGASASRRRDRRAAWVYLTGAGALVAGAIAGSLLSGGGDEVVGNEVWRWLWTGFALGMGIAEIFTAGFFLLPFAIGAAAAAILAWLGVDPVAQWLVFFGVSLIAFAYLRRFARYQDDDQPRVGANRWADARGVVLVDIDPDLAVGMVRVEGEEWRATTDGPPIPAGARVVVHEVRGSKLVVSPVDQG